MTAFDIITCGSATVDAFIRTAEEPDVEKKRQGYQLCYPLGEKILISHLDFQTGGGGTNTAVAFSRLGLKTAFLGKIGNDENGDKVLVELKKEGISFLGKREGQTGFSVILDAQHEDRTILAYKGANDTFSFKTMPHTTRWLYATSMMGSSFPELEKAVLYFKKKCAKIAFNTSYYLAEKGIFFLKKILSKTDVLILNKDEAIALLKKDYEPARAARALLDTGPKLCAVTDGKHGVWVSSAGKTLHVLPGKVKVCETTGAGDAFGATLIAGLSYGLTVEQSTKIAMINAESVISHYGAKNILLSKKEALARLKKDKRHAYYL